MGASSSAQEAAPSLTGTALGGGNLARESDGLPICGLGAEFHKGRRDALAERLGSGVLVLRGMPKPRGAETFRQDKNFWYLTGVESPDVAFVRDVATGAEVLFVSRPNAFEEQWSGEIWDTADEWVTEITGISDLREARDFEAAIAEFAGEEAPIWTVQAPWITMSGSYDYAGRYVSRRAKDPYDGRKTRERTFADKLSQRFGDRVQDATKDLYEMRIVKTEAEIEAMSRAARAGALALAEAMRSTRADLGEWELDALMSFVQQRHGADGPGYAAIVGSGPNALTLHYNTSNRRMRDGELVLADYGPEVDHYVTDITRTWPVSGKFSPRQAELYQAVLDAQAAGIAAAKPGSSLGEVDAACAELLKERGFQKLMAHSAVHWIGMEVHDPGPRAPLEPGMAFTVEPGLYETATAIGIRIEDVVVITEGGCRVISSDCPRSIAEVEALVAERGILDLLDGDRAGGRDASGER